MKIIYILPALKTRGVSNILDQIHGLIKRGNDVVLTSLDEIKGSTPYIVPTPLPDARKLFEDADVIIGFGHVCAFYVNDIETKARKYYMLFDDERDFYTREYIGELVKLDDARLDIEHAKQMKFIEASYNLKMHKIVSNPRLVTLLNGRISVFPIGVDVDVFYPDQFISKTGVIRIINYSSDLLWQGNEIVSRAISELRSFELWTFGEGKPKVRTDKHWGEMNDETTRRVFSSSDIFLNMSSIDGTCDFALKAMACGAIPVIRDVAGSEGFCKDGKNCIIIKGKTDDELAENLKNKLNELMTNKQLREDLIRGGLETKMPLEIENLEKILRRK